MVISSRTPEGAPNRCPICGNGLQIEPTVNRANTADAPCPHCGSLVWFDPPLAPSNADARIVRVAIRSWVKTLQEQSSCVVNQQAYCHSLLSGLISVLVARAAVMWRLNPQSSGVVPVVGVAHAMPNEPMLLSADHRSVIEPIISSGQSIAIDPTAAAGIIGADAGLNNSLLLLCPVKRGNSAIGVIEVFQRPVTTPLTKQGYLRFLEQMCKIAGTSVALRDW